MKSLPTHWFQCTIATGLIVCTCWQSTAADVTGERAKIGGGHTLSGNFSTITGGTNNVANKDFTMIGGGKLNTNSGDYSAISGGYNNVIDTNYCFIGGGGYNKITGSTSFIGGGGLNTNSGYQSTIVAGGNNRVVADFAFIGGGINNYVTDLSGTIVGGESHQLLGESFGFIGGGEGNGVFGTGTHAATIGGGEGNRILGNVATTEAECATIAGGVFNVITNAPYASIAGGALNTVTKARGTIPGGEGAKASHFGQLAYASGYFAAGGDAQASLYVLRRTTTSATQTELFLDNAGERMTVPSGATWMFEVSIAARSTGNTSAAYHIRGALDNISGTTSLVGVPVVTVVGEDVGAWDVVAEADDTNDALVIKVTGAASTTIRWVASVRTTEVSQ